MLTSRQERVNKVYAGVAPNYEPLYLKIARYGTRVEDFLKGARSGQRWLDLGCANGLLTAGLPPDVEVVGLDAVTEMIVEAQKRQRAGAVYAVHDYHQPLSLDYGRFDAALAVGCFEFCSDLQVVLGHLAAALKPGAHLLFTVPEQRADLPLQSDPYNELTTPNASLGISFFSYDTVSAVVRGAGFYVHAYAFADGWEFRRKDGDPVTIKYGWWQVQKI